jgi:hypothetical protein
MKTLRIKAIIKRMALFTLFLSLASLVKAQAPKDSIAINDLLTQVKTHAALADDDASMLESYTRSSLISWQTHGKTLTQIKEHVNDLINDANEMSLMRADGSAWQQEAIDRINPLLHEMADHLTATIEKLNEDRSRVQMKPYRDYVRANYGLVHKANMLISDLADYGESKAKASSLQKDLELPAVANDKG